MISETRFTMIYAGGDLTQTVWTQVTPERHWADLDPKHLASV